MTGYITGRLADKAGASELLMTAEQSIPIAKQLGNPLLNLHGTGLDNKGLPVTPCDEVTKEMWDQAEITLNQIADLGLKHGVTFQLENLNQVDEETLPALVIDDGLEHPFEILDGDVWEKANSGETYASFIRNELDRM